MKQASVISAFLGLALLVAGCEPRPTVEQLAQNMVVQTNFDNASNFSTYSSYSMPLDTVGLIYNADPTDTLILGSYASLISREVKSNLDAAGYTRVGHEQDPDLGINIFIVRDFSVFQTVSYPSYYYSSYYYGYGYGYPYVNTYATNEATLVIEMYDLKTLNNQNQAKVIWTAYIGDLLTSIDMNTKTREAVDQAFVQSPYLKK